MAEKDEVPITKAARKHIYEGAEELNPEGKDREFLPSWAMSWEDISDAQLTEVIGKSNDERARAIVGKTRKFYRETGRAESGARIRELEIDLSNARDCAAHTLDRCGEQRKENAELKAENAALKGGHDGKEYIEALNKHIDNLDTKDTALESAATALRGVVEARDVEIKRLREALGAADDELQKAVYYHNQEPGMSEARYLFRWISKTRAKITAALKGV